MGKLITQNKGVAEEIKQSILIRDELIKANSVFNGQIKLSSPAGTTVIGGEGAAHPPTADLDGRSGWLFTKTLANTAKFNYFYYSQGNTAVTLGQLTSLSAEVSINNYQGSTSLPFFVVYTKPTGVGDAGAWYHSSIAYTLSANQIIILGERINMYALIKPEKDSNQRQVLFNEQIITGDALDSEEILTITLHSDSSAPAGTQILVDELGYNLITGIKSRTNLII